MITSVALRRQVAYGVRAPREHRTLVSNYKELFDQRWASKERILVGNNSGWIVESGPGGIRDGETAGRGAKPGGIMNGDTSNFMISNEEWLA